MRFVRRVRILGRLTNGLSLPHVFTAHAPHRIGRHFLSQLLRADRARFGHYVCHDRASHVGELSCSSTVHIAYQNLPACRRALPNYHCRCANYMDDSLPTRLPQHPIGYSLIGLTGQISLCECHLSHSQRLDTCGSSRFFCPLL
jgi:hypothetical protein